MHHSLSEREHRLLPRSAWLYGALILLAACTAARLLVAYVNSPLSASWVLIAAVGWVLYRIARASTVGTVLWCVGAAALGAGTWAPLPEDAEGRMVLLGVLGVLLPFVSSIVFLVTASRRRVGRVQNCGGCVLALFTLIIWLAAAKAIHDCRERVSSAEQTTKTLIQLHKLADEVETIRTRLGRLPANEAELVRLRGEPLPYHYSHFRIRYIRRDGDGYALTCGLSDFWGSHWDIFPWIFDYYGPQSTQRLRAIVF
jgi:hypothetical protein